MQISGPIKVEDRKSTGTLFISLHISENGIDKSIDVYYVYANLPYNPSRRENMIGRFGLEIYQGPNYVPPWNSRERSYSRHYASLVNVPEKYKKEVLPQLLRRLIHEMAVHRISVPKALRALSTYYDLKSG